MIISKHSRQQDLTHAQIVFLWYFPFSSIINVLQSTEMYIYISCLGRNSANRITRPVDRPFFKKAVHWVRKMAQQALQPDFDLLNAQGGKRKKTCPLTSTGLLWHGYPTPTHTQRNIFENNQSLAPKRIQSNKLY